MKRIVLFVEGEGESSAVPKLVSRLLTELNAWHRVTLDPNVFRVGHAGRLVKDEYREWKRFLRAALKRPGVGGVLLLLDGDAERVGGQIFCASVLGKKLSAEATSVGAGQIFSIATVFARQEYESWLIAGIESLAGRVLPDGRAIKSNLMPPDGDLEATPRDAKGWLRSVVQGGYKETRDQVALTEIVDLGLIRTRGLRSFKRLESALSQLIVAIESSKHVATP